MSYEVEQKFRIDDPDRVERALAQLGARFGPVAVQSDTYLQHPARDFGATDEAFRLRRDGDRNFLTYKGPRIDPVTKTRVELEAGLPDGNSVSESFAALFERLGFSTVVAVRKRRRHTDITWEGRRLEVVLDDVENLGSFSEIETTADEADLDAARRAVASLAAHLGLAHNERRSYCELLLERRRGA